jgi:hypothetical protein
MISSIHELNKSFESRIRLGIMSMLMVNDWVDFGTMKETLEITDGNLASHITALEKMEYVTVKKQFIGKKTNTSYAASVIGKSAFTVHLNALENIIKNR